MRSRLVVLIFLFAVTVVVAIRSDARVLSSSLSLLQYPDGGAMVQVHYRRDSSRGLVSIALDGQEVIHRFPAKPQLFWNSNFSFRSSLVKDKKVVVRVTFERDGTIQTLERRVIPILMPAEVAVRDFERVTMPTQSMTMQHSLSALDAPDIDTSNNECAPQAAADSLIALAKQHGEDGRLPADITTMLGELKTDIRWTLGNGVLPNEYVAGVNHWALAKGLPISTEKVGAQDGRETLRALSDSLASGNAAQLRLAFSVPLRGGHRDLGGHLVTVVGIHELEGKTFVDIHDPVSPRGVDTYRVDGTKILDYTLFPEGTVTLSWGFTQTWTGSRMKLL